MSSPADVDVDVDVDESFPVTMSADPANDSVEGEEGNNADLDNGKRNKFFQQHDMSNG